ncbi:MAG: hypothetical protein DI538_00575 [Azospira oryzae]|jgi:hypothetical protein|nr:hypothetical protein [Cytophaga sp.]PZR41694.1 MAG: hypothetical protein DI538_00575 [Azospira oryzae]
MRFTFSLLLLLLAGSSYAQQFLFPDSLGMKSIPEGKELAFKVTLNDPNIHPRYSLEGAAGLGIQFDTLGNFKWKPSYDLVDRLQKQKEVSVIFQADWKDGKKVRKPITFLVDHVNRPPEVEDLPVFYVRLNTQNKYQIPAEYVKDLDGDPIVFRSLQSQLPEGGSMSSAGLLTWTPSRSQFNSLKGNPLYVEFIVQDQPDKAETIGRIRIAQTQLDLPPEINIVPNDTLITIKEDELVSLKLYISDPNGDDNLSSVSFISSDTRVPKTALKENALTQYEFIWTPGYYFVEEVQKSKKIELVFFALDKSSNKVQKKVAILVNDTENLDEKDKFIYSKYLQTLSYAKTLIDELDKNLDKLNKDYKQANKGKKQRSLLSASLGAVTGVSPLLTEPGSNAAKAIPAVGGTTTLTLGTLEATEVLGKSKSAIQDKIKINIEIRNQLQVEGDNFARKYALKSQRRSAGFDIDRDKMQPILNNQKLVLLELDASRPSVRNYTVKDLKKTFPDFAGND